MDAQPIFSTTDFMEAEAACEELRSHGIKCGSVESESIAARTQLQLGPPYIGAPAGIGHTGQWDVIVAPEDVEPGTEVLRAWAARSGSGEG